MTGLKKSYDPSAVQLMGDGDQLFLQEMLQLFVRNTTISLQELQQAIESGNFSTAGALAHKMRGPVNHLGADQLSLLLKQLEELCMIQPVNREEVVHLLHQTQHESALLVHELSSDWDI